MKVQIINSQLSASVADGEYVLLPTLDRELIDEDDGENRAVRAFLQLYGNCQGITVERAYAHMKGSGWASECPAWVTYTKGHMTTAEAQSWIVYMLNRGQDESL